MVFENRVQRKILGSERDEGTGNWMRQHNEQHRDLYCSLNIILVIRSIMGWAGRVACLGGQERCVHMVLVRKLRKRDHLEGLGFDGRIILKRNF
jgi:hypothetical protein